MGFMRRGYRVGAAISSPQGKPTRSAGCGPYAMFKDNNIFSRVGAAISSPQGKPTRSAGCGPYAELKNNTVFAA